MAKRKTPPTKPTRRKKSPKNQNRNGFIFIITIFILIVGICIFYRDRISGFYNTKFKIPAFITNLTNRTSPPSEPADPITPQPPDETAENQERPVTITPETPDNERASEDEPPPQEEKDYLHAMTATLYFIKIEEDSRISLIPTRRNIKFNTKPLTKTMYELLNGPTKEEEEDDIFSTIPQNTALLSIKIKKNIAYLNFSEDFEYNGLGKESIISQLKQIVYTVTEFKNIKAVQFLIEGKQKKYLGGEGIIISFPLSRNDFS